MAQAGGPYSISGTVVNSVTGSPLSHASVSLELEQDHVLVASVTADDHGAFQFSHLAADRYELSTSHRGYLTAAYDAHDGGFSTALVTGEGQECCANLQMRLVPGGVISGVVTEDSGDPVERGRVALYRESNQTGEARMQRVRMESVDESGAYELSGLEPGNYFLAVNAEPWYSEFGGRMPGLQRITEDANSSGNNTRSLLDAVYATTFYPDTTDEDSATPIPIKGGEHLKINFSMHPVPAVHLRIQMPAMPNERFGQYVPAVDRKVFGELDPSGGGISIYHRADGSAEAQVRVAPGQYVIQMPGGGGGPGRQVTLDATADQSIDPASASAGTRLVDVTGKVALTAGGALPEDLFVTLQPVQGLQGQRRIGGLGARAEKDGSFTIRNVAPGSYHINFFAGGKRFRVARLAANGAHIDHRQITIGSEPVSLAGLIYPDLGLSLSGFAKSKGKAAPGMMMVLIPEGAADYRDFFRRDQSDWDGGFVFKDVEPGRYTVVAIEDGWTLDWSRAEVMQRYLAQGEKVTVTERSPQVVKLGEAVEVQGR